MSGAAALYEGGFADPAPQSAAAFRAALEALARPGRIERIGGCRPPAGLSPAAGGLLLSVADADTPVWVPEGAEDIAAWTLFHTGAPRALRRGDAAFAAGSWDALMPLTDWPEGTADYPDRATTLIVDVPSLEGGDALRLSGPGIKGATEVAPMLPREAVAALAANRARFPLGVDLYLAAGEAVMGLPRSTRVEAS
ncbi:MAG: phosphonate C-P lyase system protein PhnH [Pseudomonadota bacterium]